MVMAIYALEDRILFDAAGPGDNDTSGDTTPDAEQTPVESEPIPEKQKETEQHDAAGESKPASSSEDTSDEDKKDTSSKDSSSLKSAETGSSTSDTDNDSTNEDPQSDSEESGETTDEHSSTAETEPSDSDSQSKDEQLTSESEQEEQKNQIAFVSDSLTDKEAIIEALEEEEVEVVVVKSTDSGLELISETLEDREEVDAVHVFSHGGDGHFVLGTDVVDSTSLEKNKELVQGWSKALAEDGDINLYGCKIAESDTGKTFVDKLARLTQADVAASVDNTGSTDTGGDWELEYASGMVHKSLNLGSIQTVSALANFEVTTKADSGAGSLRQAILDANALPGADSITFHSSLDGETINVGVAMWIQDDLTINGAGNIILDGGGSDRIFFIDDWNSSNINVSLSGLTLQNGNADGSPGIGIHGGAILSKENLTITNSTIQNNTTSGSGGGLYSSSWKTVTINNTTFDNNSANRGGGASISAMPGITNTINDTTFTNNTATLTGGALDTYTSGGTTLISNSTFSDNTAVAGGGIVSSTVSSGTTEITDSTFSGNTATTDKGGGINATTNYSGITRISSSTFYANSAFSSGGGVYFHNWTNNAETPTVEINNSTFSGNSASDGGGIRTNDFAGNTSINNSTISDNNADGLGGGVRVYSDGGGSTTISSSILANNKGSGDDNDLFKSGWGGTLNVDHSLIEAPGGHTVENSVDSGDGLGNIVGVDPQLQPLTYNGGPTMTHALGIGSAALNNGFHPSPAGEFDQRGAGYDRNVAGVDMGAYEDQSPILVVDSLVDELDTDYTPGDFSLREAITLANSDARVDNIWFADDLNDAADGAPGGKNFIGNSGTIDMDMGQFGITDDLFIDGAGNITLDGGYDEFVPGSGSRIFYIDSADNDSAITINGLTLQNGHSGAAAGGAVFSRIEGTDHLTISNSTISGNSAGSYGGAVFALTSGTADTEINYSTISGNKTSGNNADGGGVHARTSGTGNIKIANSTISGNSTSGDNNSGGGLYAWTFGSGTTEITYSTISGNKTSAHNADAGGAWPKTGGGTTEITYSTISGNKTSGVDADGGGIYTLTYASGTTLIENSTISGNDTSGNNADGGGVYADTHGGFMIISSTIIGDNSVQGTGSIGHDLLRQPGGGFFIVFHTLIETQGGGDHTVANGVSGNIVGYDPQLGPLADNGGPTLTHALGNDSPAINGGANPWGLINDQRGDGFARVQGTIDMGAIEYFHAVDTLVDEKDTDYSWGDYSLREAIDRAQEGELITFADQLNDLSGGPWPTSGTIGMIHADGEFKIDQNLSIDGDGRITIDGGYDGADPGTGVRIFNINDPGPGPLLEVTLSGLTLQNGNAAGDVGGAIFSTESLKVVNCTITGSTALSGGGIFSDNEDGTIEILGSTISKNSTATFTGVGGGLALSTDVGGTIDISNSIISGNSTRGTSSYGGGVFITADNSSYAFISNSTFSGNYTMGDIAHGGGLFIETDNSKAIISNSTFSTNDTAGMNAYGGGLCIVTSEYSTTKITSSTVSGNETTGSGGHGGGLYTRTWKGSELEISNSLISGNTTTKNAGYGGDLFAWTRRDSTTTISHTTISDNSTEGNSSHGGGLFSKAFQSYPGGILEITIANSTITGNSTAGDDSHGGGMYLRTSDGAATTISNSIITGNSTAGDDSHGGGVWARAASSSSEYGIGILTIENSTISENRAAGDGGGVFLNSFAKGDDYSIVTINNSTISDNRAGSYGGGLFVYNEASEPGLLNQGSIVDINRTTISGNHAGYSGGGIFSRALAGTTTIYQSTLSENTAFAQGGGVFAITAASPTPPGGPPPGTHILSGTTAISNSTISGNRADYFGGGVYLNTSSGSAEIANSTIAENVGGYYGGGLFVTTSGGTTDMISTIIANNRAGILGNDLLEAGGVFNVEYSLIKTMDGHLVDNNQGTGTGGTDQNNIIDEDFMLDSLADNGGPTLTHALLAGSLAYNAGANPNTLQYDQRGPNYQREKDGQADIGAIEYFRTHVVDSLVDELDGDYGVGDYTLREAIFNADYGDKIIFAGNLNNADDGAPGGKNWIGNTGTINMDNALGQFEIDKNLIIDGDGRIGIDARWSSRIFLIDDGNSAPGTPDIDVHLAGMTLQNGVAAGPGGAIYSKESLTISDCTITGNRTTGDQAYGGGVSAYTIYGNITIENSTISNNSTAGYEATGGGLSLGTEYGTITIKNSTISNNSTAGDYGYGGGVFVASYHGTISISDLTVSDNSTGGLYAHGGGLYIESYYGRTTVSNATITGNSTADVYSFGGGLMVYSDVGTVTIDNSTISDNSTTGDYAHGGGLIAFTDDNIVSINNSTISNNSTAGSYAAGGGALVISADGIATISNTTIADNTTTGNYSFGGGLTAVVGSGTLTVENATVSGNSTGGDKASGGGIWMNNYGGVAKVSNATISGNSTAGDSAHGGGLYARTYDDGITSIENSTIAHNSTTGADSDGGGAALDGEGSATSIKSTIIGNNSATGTGNDLADLGAGNPLSVEYSLIQTADGHQVDNDPSTGSGDFDRNNIIGQDPLLDVLADNGGPTLTHALLAGSPASNSGSNPSGLGFDQRGPNYQRTQGVQTDMGAFEGTAWIVDNLVDEAANEGDHGHGDFSLREAIGQAMAGDKIMFADDLNDAPDGAPGGKNFIGDTGTINLTLGELAITGHLIIEGEGRITIDGGYDGVDPGSGSRIFNIDDSDNSFNSDVRLSGLRM